MEYSNYFDYIENIENKNVFNYICELGAQLNDFERNDARMILNDFIQEEIVDYSFTPPDRRFDESPFFLPDFNDKDDLVEDISLVVQQIVFVEPDTQMQV